MRDSRDIRRKRLPRALLGSLGFALALGLGGPAAAQGEGEGEEPALSAEETEHLKEEAEHLAEQNGASHADALCVPIIMDGGSMDECWEAPNPLLPETNELIWGAVGFLVVFFVLGKFAFPAMKKGMDARTERIRQDLQSAEDQRTDAERLRRDYETQLNEARAEATRIIEEARQTADQVQRDREAELQTELAETRARAQSDIAASKAQATEELRGDLAQLAIGAAEAVVRQSLNTKTHKQLVEDYIDRVAAGSQT